MTGTPQSPRAVGEGDASDYSRTLVEHVAAILLARRQERTRRPVAV